MSEYNHDMFPCDMPANTPEFNKGYEGITWDEEHDDLGRVVKKGKRGPNTLAPQFAKHNGRKNPA